MKNGFEPKHPGDGPDTQLIAAIGRRAENLFATRQLECAEAVLVVLNRAMGGGLSDSVAVQLASGLCNGIGGSGCCCGALSGGVLAMGLFLGRRGPGFGNGHRVKSETAELHAAFRRQFGATCCRVLTKSRKTDPAAHYRQCAHRTGWTTRTVAAAVLHLRPELAENPDWAYLRRIDSDMAGRLRRLGSVFFDHRRL